MEVIGVVGKDLVGGGEVGTLVQLAARAAPARALPPHRPLRLCLLLRRPLLQAPLPRLAARPPRAAPFFQFRRAVLLGLDRWTRAGLLLLAAWGLAVPRQGRRRRGRGWGLGLASPLTLPPPPTR